MTTEDTAPAALTFEEFMKVDIRSGVILSAEAVAKSDKLLKLSVSFGHEVGQRTILAGIAKSYNAEELVGARVLAVVNLAPRKMMGFESHGMLLAGQTALGTVKLANCPQCEPGTRIG
jgi:methionyl-tRNA synthetase